jgi:hypothetical protein
MALTSDFNPTNPVPFSRMRYLLSESGGGLQAGVVGASDFMVVQRGAGANMSVDVGTGGAWVAVTTGTRNGLAHCFNDAVANVTITAAHATLPRIDQIYLRYNDSSIPTGSGDIPTLAVGTGTATSGATLANRTGAIALPADTLRLADVLVAAADTSITNTEIRDRRPWARGGYVRIVRNANAAAGNDYTTSSAGLTDVDATNLKPRLELSGAPVRLSLRVSASHSVGGGQFSVLPAVDGALLDGATGADPWTFIAASTGGQGNYINLAWDFVPAAGSHLVGPQFKVITAGTLTLIARATIPLQMAIEELVRPNTANNTTTSG